MTAEIFFHSAWHPAIIIFIIILAGAASIYSYRTTVPPVSRNKRIMLTIIRAAGLALLGAALAEPALTLLSSTEQRPLVAVLIDDTQSMNIADVSGPRSSIIRSLLSNSSLLSGKDIETAYFRFTDKLIRSNKYQPLTFLGNETDIAGSIQSLKKELQEKNLQAVVLISDGNSTIGQNPLYIAEEMNLPFYTIGVGDSTEQKDILISDVVANSIAYTDNAFPVDVTLKSINMNSVATNISISDGTTIIEKKNLSLSSGTSNTNIQFSVVPKEEGIHKYTVRVSPVAGEYTTKNNYRSFFVKVLKSKMHVLIIAGAPNPDVAFVKRVLALDKNMSVESYVQKNETEFYEGDITRRQLDSAECILFIGFPTTQTSTTTLSMIRSSIERNGQPLLFIPSRTIDKEKLSILEPFLPFTILSTSSDEREIGLHITDRYAENAIFRFASSDPKASGSLIERQQRWSTLPPIYATESHYKPKPESEVLATSSMQGVPMNEPLLITKNLQHQKSLAILAYGLWRWELMLRPQTDDQAMLSAFLGNSVRWLTTREDTRRVVITPNKPIVPMGEPVLFTAQVYDENYHPIENADVQVTVNSQGISASPVFHSLGAGRYEAACDGLMEGDYSYEGSAQFGNQVLGKDRGKFSVGEINSEFITTSMNAPLLRQIADCTKGAFFPLIDSSSASSLHIVLPDLNKEVKHHAAEFTLWNSFLYLLLMLFCFSIEWFLRKFYGMI